MSVNTRNAPALKKVTVTLAIALLGLSSAQAEVVNGTIYKTVDPVHGAGTTIDFYSFSLSSAANVVIDVLANEGYAAGWGAHPGAYVDLNGDGELTLADSQFRIFQDTVSLDTEIVSGDDSPAYTIPGNTGGWADGSLLSRDSYLATALDVGNYIIAFGDYSLTIEEAVLGFNKGDTITGATGLNPVTGATGQDHFDYQITLTATDYVTGANLPLTITGEGVSAVPVPGAVWLFGSALAGLGVFGKRRTA
ncbi:hypothetical protein A1353_12295 [Methylomonas methanica]|uniref:Secreted protein n=1 Tax=Methylomonas methanica TaxID=421 RepID=A0A177MGW0_METMH|nr:VPLPA-CTERM sorting domain-containing protein [Methylomonas methanica]OAI04852.1 hypothetical protein A1353_12295 [Methylomonas methanica]